MKFAGTYHFDWFGHKSNTTDFNMFYLIGSGTPVTTRARYNAVSGQIVSKRGDLGRTAMLSQTDFSVTHKYRFGRENRYAVAFDVNILNLWNQETEIGRRETINKSNFPGANIGCVVPIFDPVNSPARCLDLAPFNGTVTSAILLAYANSGTNKDTRYNLPQLFQNPRNVRFGFRFLF